MSFGGEAEGEPQVRRLSLHDVGTCPFVEHGDASCNGHFTLGHLSDAFGDCFGDYRRCPHFQRLLGGADQPPIGVTVHGRALQPTGT